jgi:hypothetical protein
MRTFIKHAINENHLMASIKIVYNEKIQELLETETSTRRN